MPRRKVRHIAATELACFGQIVAELEARGDFEGYDFTTRALSLKQQVEPTIRPTNLEKAIDNIQRHIAINCKEPFDYIVGVSRLAKIAKVSRPTMNRWCEDGFVRPGVKNVTFANTPDDLYDLELVLAQLRSVK